MKLRSSLYYPMCMDDKMYELIALLETTKEAWDTLHEIFEGLRCRNIKKEDNNKP